MVDLAEEGSQKNKGYGNLEELLTLSGGFIPDFCWDHFSFSVSHFYCTRILSSWILVKAKDREINSVLATFHSEKEMLNQQSKSSVLYVTLM